MDLSEGTHCPCDMDFHVIWIMTLEHSLVLIILHIRLDQPPQAVDVAICVECGARMRNHSRKLQPRRRFEAQTGWK